MKHTKLLAAVLLMLAMVLPAFGKPMELTLLYGVETKPAKGFPLDGYPSIEGKVIAQFQRETGVLVNRKLIDLSTGSTMSMDALVAAGIAPDVYSDFAGRVAKYMVPEFSLDFKGYFKDLDDFIPSILESVTRNGKILAVPTSSWATGFCVNEDLLAEVGYKIPADWTIDEFLKVAELLKAKGKYVTVLFTKNQSSDQGWMPFFYAFGARVYNQGDYTKTVLNQPKALNTLKFFQSLVDKGYVPPDPTVEDDDTALDLFGRGKVAFLSAQIGHLPVIESAVKQGLIPKAFKVSFVEFPHAKGEKPTPTASGPTLNIVHKTKDEAKNKAAARLAWYITNTEFQTHVCVSQGSFPSRKSVGTPMADNPNWVQIAGIIAKNGVCDFGITTQTFTAVRAQMFPLLSEMYMGKMTPEEVLKTYEKNVNNILAGK